MKLQNGETFELRKMPGPNPFIHNLITTGRQMTCGTHLQQELASTEQSSCTFRYDAPELVPSLVDDASVDDELDHLLGEVIIEYAMDRGLPLDDLLLLVRSAAEHVSNPGHDAPEIAVVPSAAEYLTPT